MDENQILEEEVGDSGDSQEQNQEITTEEEKPQAPSKFWGRYSSEDEARMAHEQIVNTLQHVYNEKQAAEKAQQAAYQQEMQRRASVPIEQRPMEEDEELFLKRYKENVDNKKFTEALLLLKRDIEGKSMKNAAEIARAVYQEAANQNEAPKRSKQEFLENQQLADLHPVADAAIMLDQVLSPYGYKKSDVLQLIRNIQGAAPKKKNLGMEEPSKTSWADLSDGDLDKKARSFWKGMLGTK
jgi:hypothetical protein